MITNYLKELLNDNECVIVPEFGAFISKRHSATIDYANHRFLPPYKEIVFNNKLNNNDDILADFIAQKENISKEEALNKIRDFVNQSVAILDVNSELELEGFGKFININGNYIFKVKEDVNVLGDSFGLTEFNYQPVFRTETYQIIKEKIVVEQKEKNTDYTLAIECVEDTNQNTVRRKPSLFKALAYSTIAFALLFVINWSTEKSGSNLASWNPFLYSSPNEFLIGISGAQEELGIEGTGDMEQGTGYQEFMEQGISNLDSQILSFSDSQISSESQQLRIPATQNLSNSESQTTTETQQLSNLAAQENNLLTHRLIDSLTHYYIIGGSFQTEESADKCLNGIKKQGFEKASTLDKNDKGYIRVYYESFADKADALSCLDVIKSEFNESAWLLFQK